MFDSRLIYFYDWKRFQVVNENCLSNNSVYIRPSHIPLCDSSQGNFKFVLLITWLSLTCCLSYSPFTRNTFMHCYDLWSKMSSIDLYSNQELLTKYDEIKIILLVSSSWYRQVCLIKSVKHAINRHYQILVGNDNKLLFENVWFSQNRMNEWSFVFYKFK